MKNAVRKESLTSKTFMGLFWTVFGSGFQAIIKIGVLAVLARLISPEEFGLVNAAMVVIGFSLLFTQLGIGPALIQIKNLEKIHITTGYWLTIIFGIAISVILFLSSSLISSFFRMPELKIVMKVLSGIFIIDALAVVPISLLQRKMQFKKIIIIEFLSYLIGYGIIGIILAYLDFGIWALIFGQISQAIIKTLSLSIFSKHTKEFVIIKKATRELLFFGGGFTLAKISNYFALQGDYLVVGRWLGASALGIYGRAYQIMVMPVNLFGTALDRVMFPAMASIQDNKRKLTEAYIKGVAGFSIISLPVSIFIIILAPEIVLVFLGPKWTDVIIPLQILASGLFFRMSYKMSDTIARSVGAVYKRAWRQMIYAIAVFIGAGIGQLYGIVGVAVGVLIALIINYILMAQLSFTLINCSLFKFIKELRYGFFLAIVTGPVIILTKTALTYFGLNQYIILALESFIFIFTVLFLQKKIPSIFLGKHGEWLFAQLKEFVPKKFHSLPIVETSNTYE